MDQQIHNQPKTNEEGSGLRREVDSIDDFEHLGHDDSSPLKETGGVVGTTVASAMATPPARDQNLPTQPINTVEGVGFANITPPKITDELSSSIPPPTNTVISDSLVKAKEMDSNLLDLSDNFQNCNERDDKLDKFLQDMSMTSQPQLKHNEPPEIMNKQKTEDFLKQEKRIDDKIELLSDSDHSDDDDDFKPSKYEDFPKQAELPELSSATPPKIKEDEDTFKDIDEKLEISKPPEMVKMTSSPPPPPPVAVKEEIKPTAPPAVEPIPPKIEPACKLPLVTAGEQEQQQQKDKGVKKSTVIDAEAIFCKMGLVESLIYWRDPKKSGPIFGGVLLVLLALTYFSLISVIAYLSLLALTGTISFRIYKNVVQAVQKTGDGHPFKEYLEYDFALPQDKVKEISEVAVAHLNAAVIELRRLFLVEDLVDSVKFGVLLWTLTYLGAWFNGMTLIIIAWVALFTLPKVYETNKTQIDANLEIVRTKLAEITSKVKAAIPIGKKPAVEEKKEQ